MARKRTCVSLGKKKWIVDKIEYFYDPDSQTGSVVGHDEIKIRDYVLFEPMDVTSKAEVKLLFEETFCISKVDAVTASEECESQKPIDCK